MHPHTTHVCTKPCTQTHIHTTDCTHMCTPQCIQTLHIHVHVHSNPRYPVCTTQHICLHTSLCGYHIRTYKRTLHMCMHTHTVPTHHTCAHSMHTHHTQAREPMKTDVPHTHTAHVCTRVRWLTPGRVGWSHLLYTSEHM